MLVFMSEAVYSRDKVPHCRNFQSKITVSSCGQLGVLPTDTPLLHDQNLFST